MVQRLQLARPRDQREARLPLPGPVILADQQLDLDAGQRQRAVDVDLVDEVGGDGQLDDVEGRSALLPESPSAIDRDGNGQLSVRELTRSSDRVECFFYLIININNVFICQFEKIIHIFRNFI